MGAAVLLLVLLMGPTAYAETAIYNAVYVPKSPRRPIIMVWPSVMNPSVAKKVVEKVWEREQNEKTRQYLRIKCSLESHSVVLPFKPDEIRKYLDPSEERSRAPKFLFYMVPKLIEWLSAEVLECGFNTIFAEKRQALYRFISYNRSNWVKALQELSYILLQVIAVIHHKTSSYKSSYKNTYFNETLNWLEEWLESYEYWYKLLRQNEDALDDALDYLETLILGSFDIVTAWLFDYIANYSNTHKWELSDDPDTTCALRSYDMYNTSMWEYLMDTVKDTVKDKMKAMADMFITCNVTSGCENYDPINIYIGEWGVQKKVVRIPDPTDCEHTCTLLPNAPPRHKYYALVHAHMTTEVGHDLYCRIRGTKITHYFSHNIVRKECRPQIVQKYLNDRANKICCGDPSLACCKSLRPRCEIVTPSLSLTNFSFESNRTLWRDMTTFEELQIANAKSLGE